jgi:hypothetical protein
MELVISLVRSLVTSLVILYVCYFITSVFVIFVKEVRNSKNDVIITGLRV